MFGKRCLAGLLDFSESGLVRRLSLVRILLGFVQILVRVFEFVLRRVQLLLGLLRGLVLGALLILRDRRRRAKAECGKDKEANHAAHSELVDENWREEVTRTAEAMWWNMLGQPRRFSSLLTSAATG